jgi:lactate dehydrogenase-like 2-hydroxyacid dehydrogenase
VRDGHWPRPAFRRSLRELNVGVVGLGAIGRAVARRLAPFGCELRWTGPRFRETPYRYVAGLGELAEWADLLIVAARADASNERLIDAEILRKLGPDGLLVNVSRGGIIDEDALIAALNSHGLGGAALDVFRSEPTPPECWRDVPNTVLTPHVGGFASGVRREIRALLAANVRAFFGGGELTGVVSPPRS